MNEKNIYFISIKISKFFNRRDDLRQNARIFFWVSSRICLVFEWWFFSSLINVCVFFYLKKKWEPTDFHLFLQARFWMQVVDELRRGVRLKKSNFSRTPVEYELTPYEILMEDIRARWV